MMSKAVLALTFIWALSFASWTLLDAASLRTAPPDGATENANAHWRQAANGANGAEWRQLQERDSPLAEHQEHSLRVALTDSGELLLKVLGTFMRDLSWAMFQQKYRSSYMVEPGHEQEVMENLRAELEKETPIVNFK